MCPDTSALRTVDDLLRSRLTLFKGLLCVLDFFFSAIILLRLRNAFLQLADGVLDALLERAENGFGLGNGDFLFYAPVASIDALRQPCFPELRRRGFRKLELVMGSV
jgi:hypothetical protein